MKLTVPPPDVVDTFLAGDDRPQTSPNDQADGRPLDL